MQDLFTQHGTPPISLTHEQGELLCFPDWLQEAESEEYFRLFLQQLAWKSETLTLGGRQIQSPRLVAWYGEPGVSYRYSGVRHVALPWHEKLLELKKSLEKNFSSPINSVLANLYRNGRDSVSWHADAEPELGREPVIFSLSLGCPRFFDFRLKADHGKRHRIELKPGMLLIMRGRFQHFWQHQVPKQTKVDAARINLTFRYIHAVQQDTDTVI